MVRAVWNGTVIAEAPRTVRVEGNDYFPPEALHREHLTDSTTRSVCPWKGVARYYDVVIAGQVNPAAAWYYPRPGPLARKIAGYVAFGNGVRVEGAPDPATASDSESRRRWWRRPLPWGG